MSVSPRSQGQGNHFKVTGDVDILMLFVESVGTPLYKKLCIWQKVPQSARLTKGVNSYSGNAQIDGVTFIEGLFNMVFSFH